MKPISTPRHEAQESPKLERKEHRTGKELSKKYLKGKSMRGGKR